MAGYRETWVAKERKNAAGIAEPGRQGVVSSRFSEVPCRFE